MPRPPTPHDNVQRFLAQARAAGLPAKRAPRRVLFALDATASRESTWDLAMNLHAELFQVAAGQAGANQGGGAAAEIAVQLAYYRGFNEFHASPWSTSAAELLGYMTGVACRGGLTQIQRLLEHTLSESKRGPIRAAVFIGDACEEPRAALLATAGKLALFNVPCFIFQEGDDPGAARVFGEIAGITGGAHAPFAAGSADRLRALFNIVARYAAHGRAGVDEIDHDAARGVLAQLPP